jgi:hypothetical protein
MKWLLPTFVVCVPAGSAAAQTFKVTLLGTCSPFPVPQLRRGHLRVFVAGIRKPAGKFASVPKQKKGKKANSGRQGPLERVSYRSAGTKRIYGTSCA